MKFWTMYILGNTWGWCEDGSGGLGCGPQEEFRSCSDISITNSFYATEGSVYDGVEEIPVEILENNFPDFI